MNNQMSTKKNSWQLRTLTVVIAIFMFSHGAQASVERHGDLQIYKSAKSGAPVITLMLDVSGSMRTIDEPPRGCSYNGDKPYEENKYGYTTYFCKSGGVNFYRRIDNLKMGVSDLVNSPELKGKVNLGIGTYPLSSANNSKAEVSGNGHIDVPANILDDAHASDIRTFIKNLQPTWNTPIAQAYGEVGAYMMGTKTNSKVTTPYYLHKETYQIDTGFLGWGFGLSRGSDKKCIDWNSINKNQISINSNLITCKTWQNVSRLNEKDLENDGNQFDRTEIEKRFLGAKYHIDIYARVVAENDFIISNNNIVPYPLIDTTLVENKYSGFKYSVDGTKNDTKINYKSPLPESRKSCAGNGIYFLTDGYPNQSSATIAKSVMNNSLDPLTGTQKLTVECSGTGEKAWPCTLDYSQKLLSTDNPSGIEIKTATVGFGSAFSSIRSANTEAECEAGDNDDVKNLCKWGIRGKGGFYYAENGQDIVNSIKSLTGKLTEDIPPISTGSMAVPLDDLNVSTSRKFAYLPLLDPQPLAPNRLWKGNLKKYNIKNGTLVDKYQKAVFANKDGVFATNTADIYNTLAGTSRPDKALPQVGGTFPHIFGNGNSRKLYVNQGGELKGIGTNSAADKPVGFKDLNTYSNLQKQQLLYFLGFPVAPETKDTNGRIINNGLIVDDDKAIGVAFDPTKKQLGGVLHSLPQLISKNAELQADGTIDNTKREDYVLYGSFDGALHVIRDTDSGINKAGEEVFTFIPKHVLDQQGESFINPDRIANNPVFGVDGPWSVFTNYKYSSTKVEAQQSLAFGGLRMGGSMYYGLNLSDLNNPKMIYSVGSTYAIDGSSSAKGVKNDIKADSQKAYAKMGLSFAKPSVGYVMKGGERVMVNFLAGGYDRCYEDPNFKLGAAVTTNIGAGCNGKTSAQGNGVYVVQVGQEKIDTTVTDTAAASNESSFDTTSGNGDLLWWASDPSNGAATNNFTPVQDMTHSVVTEIRALDRNYDGLTDQLVFADLGGRVWRVDINSSEDIKDFKIDRVVKTLDLSAAGTNTALGTTDAPPRIYEKPLVTFTRLGEGTDIVGLVTVGTGDRSSPVTAERKVADRIYTFVDRDIARADLFCYNLKSTTINECENVTTTLKQTAAITPASLVELTTNATTGEFTNTATIKTQMDAYTKLGWFLPLTLWSETVTKKKADGTNETVPVVSTDNKGIKMFNQPDAIAGLLFTTVYNPKVGDTSGACSAGVTGLTQREQMCLPYGVCMSKGADGDWLVRKTRYLSNAGIGIVDNIISDGNFSGDTKNSVVVLENFCEGANCSAGKQELITNPITEELNCQGMSCKVVTDSQLDPMQWKER